jgi:hypothetical protein
VQLARDSDQQEGVQNEVEEIENPGEKTQDNNTVMRRRQRRALVKQ